MLLISIFLLFLFSCGIKKDYVPDYVLEGKEEVELFDTKTKTVKWIKEEWDFKVTGYVKVSDTTSIGVWEIKIEKGSLIIYHLPTGRVYRIKLNLPFPLTHVAVGKEAEGKLFIKTALDGHVYIIDPHLPHKEVGFLGRGYLFDDGILVLREKGLEFCDYGFRNCVLVQKRPERGKITEVYRINNGFIFYVEGREGRKWVAEWRVVNREGEIILRKEVLYKVNGYYYPFYLELDKQYVYARRDYYSNPYFYGKKKKPPVSYKDFLPPALFVLNDTVYFFSCYQKPQSFRQECKAEVRRKGYTIFEVKKETALLLPSFSVGFCGSKVLIEFDGIWYNPEDGKKVKCTKLKKLFYF